MTTKLEALHAQLMASGTQVVCWDCGGKKVVGRECMVCNGEGTNTRFDPSIQFEYDFECDREERAKRHRRRAG